MRSGRLLSLLLLLQAHGRLPASDLAARLEVSVRTVMRDVEALSSSGVPVYTDRGRYGGIGLLPGYRTDVTGLTADESKALFVLLSDAAHAELGLGQAIGSALRKLMVALPQPHRADADLASRRILIDPVRWRATGRPAVDLGILQEAIFTDRRLTLRYRHSEDGRVRLYTLDPYGLVNKAGVWYLVADHRRRPKLFRADRIQSATIAATAVRRRPGIELADAWDSLRRRIDDIPTPIKTTIYVRRESLAKFLRVHAADVADPPAPGGPESRVLVNANFRSLAAAEQLLAFATDIEVLAPPELRELLSRKAAATAALYS